MGLSAAEELGKIIASSVNAQARIEQDFIADDPNQSMLMTNAEKITVNLKVTGTKKLYKTDSFIIDHPTQGIVDSPTLLIDGGYATAVNAFSLPVSFPLTFNEIAEGDEIVFTYES